MSNRRTAWAPRIAASTHGPATPLLRTGRARRRTRFLGEAERRLANRTPDARGGGAYFPFLAGSAASFALEPPRREWRLVTRVDP